jgi:hypothetical protein
MILIAVTWPESYFLLENNRITYPYPSAYIETRAYMSQQSIFYSSFLSINSTGFVSLSIIFCLFPAKQELRVEE